MGNFFRKKKKIIPIENLDKCVICQEYYKKNNKLKLPCKHIIHEECFIEFINKSPNITCPICRNDLKKFIKKYKKIQKLKKNMCTKILCFVIYSILIVPLTFTIGNLVGMGIIFGLAGIGISFTLTFFVFTN
jgi:E3 ubiquitin-protein ligase DOA10